MLNTLLIAYRILLFQALWWLGKSCRSKWKSCCLSCESKRLCEADWRWQCNWQIYRGKNSPYNYSGVTGASCNHLSLLADNFPAVWPGPSQKNYKVITVTKMVPLVESSCLYLTKISCSWIYNHNCLLSITLVQPLKLKNKASVCCGSNRSSRIITPEHIVWWAVCFQKISLHLQLGLWLEYLMLSTPKHLHHYV